MSVLSITITNSVRVFGDGPATRWGQAFGTPYTMTWGTTKWGENSVPLLKNFVFQMTWNQPLHVTGTYGSLQTIKNLNLGISVSHNMINENLRDGSNTWSYIFTSDTSNAETRSISSYTSVTVSAQTFSCAGANSTVWS